MNRFLRILLGMFPALVLAVVAALFSPPGEGVELLSENPTRSQDANASRLEVDTGRSVLVARLKRGGLLRFLGHDHGVVPESWSAEVRFDPADLDASSIVVEIEAPALVVDSEEARRLAGVDPDGPSDADVREIQAKMLSEEQLDAAAFPRIRFESSTVRAASDNELRIDGTLTLHGVSREIGVDAAIENVDNGYVVRGEIEIEQRAFGIEPVSIGGVVNVANEVTIRFEVYAVR